MKLRTVRKLSRLNEVHKLARFFRFSKDLVNLKPTLDQCWLLSALDSTADTGVPKVQKSGPSCIYVALAGPKSAVGHFPQSEEQPIWDQLVCFITVALKLLSTPSYITLLKMLSKCVCKQFLINLVMQHSPMPDFYVLVEFCQIWNFISVSILCIFCNTANFPPTIITGIPCVMCITVKYI